MPKVSNRLVKISDMMARELAVLIQNEMSDPRVSMVSITGVKVSRDLAHASVFVTVMGKSSADEAEDALSALNKASGYLRTLLAKEMNLRNTPSLKFHYDESIARGSYLSDLIEEAVASDRRLHDDESDDDGDQSPSDAESRRE